MKKLLFSLVTFLSLMVGPVTPLPIKAENSGSSALTVLAAAGAGYIGYKAWHIYTGYMQDRLFQQAYELLRQADFWGNNGQSISVGRQLIEIMDGLAAQGYKPALYFQAEHPWLFVDGIVSHYQPSITPAIFYSRYADYSIECYLRLAHLGDREGYFSAGVMGICKLYIHQSQGVPYQQIAPEVKEYLGYLDRAACSGHAGAVQELVRVYQEGVLVPYNQRMVVELPGYYHGMWKIYADNLYPIAQVKVWLYKKYYGF